MGNYFYLCNGSHDRDENEFQRDHRKSGIICPWRDLDAGPCYTLVGGCQNNTSSLIFCGCRLSGQCGRCRICSGSGERIQSISLCCWCSHGGHGICFGNLWSYNLCLPYAVCESSINKEGEMIIVHVR